MSAHFSSTFWPSFFPTHFWEPKSTLRAPKMTPWRHQKSSSGRPHGARPVASLFVTLFGTSWSKIVTICSPQCGSEFRPFPARTVFAFPSFGKERTCEFQRPSHGFCCFCYLRRHTCAAKSKQQRPGKKVMKYNFAEARQQ